MGSLKVAEMAVAKSARTKEPFSGETRLARGGVASVVRVMTVSAVEVALPPVSVARTLRVKDGCSAIRAVTNRCSKAKLPSVATFTPSTKNSTLRT